MNSLFKKVATSLSLLALSFGIGLTGRGLYSVKAEGTETSASFGTGTASASGVTPATITWSLADSNITMVQNKGVGSTAVNSQYVSAARVYVGHYLHFKSINEYKINKVEIAYSTYTSTSDTKIYCGEASITAGVLINDNIVTDDTTKIVRTLETQTGGKHTFTIADDVHEFYIQNSTKQSGGTQLRWDPSNGTGGVKIYYTKPASTGEITSLTVKAPDDTTGEYTVTTGYVGRKSVQLSAEVIKTGNLSSTVTWSSADTTAMSVTDDGLVKILKSSPSGVVITATSVADTSKSGSITIKTTISPFPGGSEFVSFDKSTFGNDKIVTTSDKAIIDLSGPLANSKLTIAKADGSNDPGFYTSSPISLRAYQKNTIKLESLTHKIHWIDFEFSSSNPMESSRATSSVGTLSKNSNTTSTLDLYGIETTSVTFTMTGTVNITKLTYGFIERVISKLEIDITEAGDLSFAKDSSFTSETALANKVKAIATFDDNTTLDVTEMAVWSLDTSAVGTASLTVMYKGITSSPVSVNIVASTIAVTSITITPNTGLEVYSGQTIQFSVDVLPSNATEKGVTWSVSPSNYGSITEDGLFTAGGATNEGTVTVTATAKDGSGVTNSVTVTFSEYPYQVASSVNGGDQVIFINDNQNKYLSGMSDKYAIASDCVDNFALPTYVFTLVAGTQDGSFAFKHGDKYLNWTKDNSLEQVDTITNNSSWTISIDADRLATITNVADTTRLIKYNGDRFATYLQNTTAPKLRLLKLKGESGGDDALLFGARFLNGFSAICTQDNTTDTAMLKEKWNQLVSVYTSLSNEAKAYIAMKQADETSTNNVEKMLALYNYIYHKYGTSLSLTNWLGRSEATKMSNRITIANTNNDNQLLVAALIVSSLSALSLLGFMIIKKRKET